MTLTHPEPEVQGYRDPNFPNPDGDMDTPIIIYGYTPSFALAMVAVVWFFLSFIFHLGQTIRYRSWWFIPFSVGLGFEVVGYIARSLSAKKDPYHLIYYIINYFFIVTAPVLMAAGIYTILSIMIKKLGAKHSPFAPKAILWFFITSDAIATVVQVTGAALVGRKSAARQDPTAAGNVLLAGLAYQVFAMTAFVAICGLFIFRAWRVISDTELRLFIGIFSVSTALIYLRTVFRLAEAAQGLWGSLQVHEVYFACLEFAPVAVAVLLFGAWHPARCLRDETEPREKTSSVV